MKHYIHILIAFPLLAGATLWQGISSDRWGIGDDVLEAAARLKDIPLTIETRDDSGNNQTWKATELKISKRQLKIAEAKGYVFRKYVRSNPSVSKSQYGDSWVKVIVLCGRPGPIALHSPTICFPGTGLKKLNDVKNIIVRSPNRSELGEFHWCEFAVEEDKNVRRFPTMWTWSTDDSFEVPENPRRSFASRSYLYRIYVIRERIVPPDETEEYSIEDDDLSIRFLQAFIPELKKALQHQKSK